MNAGGGEAADQMVRMMLSGGEVTIRLTGSALKNMLALSMALMKNHKTLSGKVNMRRMLNETRDLRVITLSPEDYKKFEKSAKKQKILFSAIRSKDQIGQVVDVVLPTAELERANLVFQRIQKTPEKSVKKTESELEKSSEEQPPKKEFRSAQDLSDTRSKSSSKSEKISNAEMNDRPSIEQRLKDFRAKAAKRDAPAREKTKVRHKNKSKSQSR